MVSDSSCGDRSGGAVVSVVVPAHDEAAVIDRCLSALLADAAPGEVDVVVACNGCTDDTAERARRHGPDVRVVEVVEPGKIGALNAGDAAARGFPRLYLDADVVLTTAAARATAATLTGAVMAAAPRPQVDTDGCPRVIAWHHRAWTALPVIREGYVGSGVYALTRAGHERVAPFPEVIADDEYVRRMFTAAERATAPVTFTFHPPRTVAAYLARALRGRAGNVELDRSDLPFAPRPDGGPPGGARALLALLRRPTMWGPVASFVALTALVRARLALRGDAPVTWNRDLTSRAPLAGGAGSSTPAGGGAPARSSGPEPAPHTAARSGRSSAHGTPSPRRRPSAPARRPATASQVNSGERAAATAPARAARSGSQ